MMFMCKMQQLKDKMNYIKETFYQSKTKHTLFDFNILASIKPVQVLDWQTVRALYLCG